MHVDQDGPADGSASRYLGWGSGCPIIAAMNPKTHNPDNPDNPDHGFQFPGEFEITAMGPADAGLEVELPTLLRAAGITVIEEKVTTRASSGGKYVSVRLGFHAASREEYDSAHAAVRTHPDVKWTL